MSNDQGDSTVPASHTGLQLPLYPESHCSNSSMSASPDSNSSISNMSETEAVGSSDINMLESCINECSPVDNLYNTTFTQCNAIVNLNQTFTCTADSDSMNIWNGNGSLSENEESGSKRYQTFSNYTEGERIDAQTSPDSTEKDFCSLSSEEMIIRDSSCCGEDHAPLVVSSLDELSFTAGDHRAFSTESNLLPTTLTDVSEKSSDQVVKENTGPTCLGVTFTLADNWVLPTEENDLALSNSLGTLPSENEGGLLMTFICETSANCGKEAKNAGSRPELAPCLLEAITPEQGKTFVTHQSAVQDNDKILNTSTPIQYIENKIPNLSSFSESPCYESSSTPGLHPARQKQISVTPAHRGVGGLTQSANKVKKLEIKKFPKSDFSHVKSKILTRACHQRTAPGSASQGKASQLNMNKPIEAHKGSANNRMSPAKPTEGATSFSTATNVLNGSQSRGNTKLADLRQAMKLSHVVDGEDEGRAFQSEYQPPAIDNGAAFQCNDNPHEAEQAASQQPGSDTACSLSSEKSPDGGGQIGPQLVPNKVVSGKNEVGSCSALGQAKPPDPKTRLRCSSEGSSVSQKPKKKRLTLKFPNSLTTSRFRTHQGQTKLSNLNCTSQKKQVTQVKETDRSSESHPQEDKKISLVEEISKSTTAGPAGEGSKSKFRGQASSKQTRSTLLPQTPAASSGLSSLPAKSRLGTPHRDACRTPKAGATLQPKQKNITGSNRVQPTGEPSKVSSTAAGIKLPPTGSRPPLTPIQSSFLGLPFTPSYRPYKTPRASKSRGEATEQGRGTGNSQVSGGAAPKSTTLKSVFRGRLFSCPGKITEPALTPVSKVTAATSKGTISLKRSASARLIQPISSAPVDKNKSKAGNRQQPPQPPASQPNPSHGAPDVVRHASVAEDQRKDHVIQQLRGLLTAGNRRFEAVAIVLQQILAARDETTEQCRELAQELVNLRGELVCSVHSSERLEKEKGELRVSLEDAVHRVQEQHQQDLAELEQRLQTFYQAEYDKVHLTYQEEADKCKTLVQQQLRKLEAKHEALKLELQNSHVEQLQSVKQQYKTSLEELREAHNKELQSLDKTLKDAEASLSGRIQELTVKNNDLVEKLTAEERRRKELAQKSQKDSHALYLEQELESLKVVLDIKTEQLRQQEKKLMEINKLTEKNVKLDESLKKVQQENEELKARMDRHAALSKQLSTEQVVLQQSLQKESKVNKRLSMENEELLWKLTNGDLSSPRKVSPTSSSSPSHSFSFQSPRSSSVISNQSVSPS